MTLPADESAVLTPVSYENAYVALAADLEPAAEVAGDGLDFCCDRDRLTFAVFDAMGNDQRSAELVAVVLAAYHQARRDQLTLAATATRLDQVVTDRCAADAYCTGVLAELDTDTGALRILNAGHPSPLVLDPSAGTHEQLPAPGNLPFGLRQLLDEPTAPAATVHALRPGQTVVLYSDGVTEARSPNREFLGSHRLATTLTHHLADGLTPHEAAASLMRFLHDFQGGSLRDDATLLLALWRAPAPPRMTARLTTP